MLSNEEKEEMLEDAKSAERRAHFRFAKSKKQNRNSTIDEYLLFLNNIQKIFAPFKILRLPTSTRKNKL